MAHSLVMAGEVCPERQDVNQSQRNLRPSILVSEMHYSQCRKLSPRKRSRLLEPIGSVVVAVPADYTRYFRTNCASVEGIRRNCQARRYVASVGDFPINPSASHGRRQPAADAAGDLDETISGGVEGAGDGDWMHTGSELNIAVRMAISVHGTAFRSRPFPDRPGWRRSSRLAKHGGPGASC